jgi:hypothetical protein
VQKTLAEPRGAVVAFRGCSQCAPVMGVTERPASVTSQGGVSAEELMCEPPPCGRSMGSSPQLGSRRDNTGIPPCHSGAWRCHVEITANHSDRMKSHVVWARLSSKVSVIHKAMPKRCVMRRIREAVSGSTDSWDGSRAVVARRFSGAGETQNRIREHARFGVDMGKLAARLKPPNGPPGPLSGNPASPLRNVPQYPSNHACGSIVTGDSHG